VPKTKACGYWIAAFAGHDYNRNQMFETEHQKIPSDIPGLPTAQG
jgi:hypothetical protein